MARQPGTYATLDTSEGTIVCRLFEKEAPKTVQNFIDLAEGKREWKHPSTGKKSSDRLYDGTIFHRVIPNFMVQGGDPAGTGFGGPGYQFEDETKGSPHKFDMPGKLAMANAGPNTNGSQFFITVAPTQWLTGKHTIFGEVVEGQDVVDKIVNVPRGRNDRPNKDVVVKSVTIERAVVMLANSLSTVEYSSALFAMREAMAVQPYSSEHAHRREGTAFSRAASRLKTTAGLQPLRARIHFKAGVRRGIRIRFRREPQIPLLPDSGQCIQYADDSHSHLECDDPHTRAPKSQNSRPILFSRGTRILPL